jgi:hypothetical protein
MHVRPATVGSEKFRPRIRGKKLAAFYLRFLAVFLAFLTTFLAFFAAMALLPPFFDKQM